MNCAVPSLLRRWLTLLMVGLLALGPFLHGHFGSSHDSGFHLDGVHALHMADASSGVNQASQEESPALGVSASLPQPENDGQSMLLCALLGVLPLLPPLRRASQPRSHHARPPKHALYGQGLPPPSLAPPAV